MPVSVIRIVTQGARQRYGGHRILPRLTGFTKRHIRDACFKRRPTGSPFLFRFASNCWKES